MPWEVHGVVGDERGQVPEVRGDDRDDQHRHDEAEADEVALPVVQSRGRPPEHEPAGEHTQQHQFAQEATDERGGRIDHSADPLPRPFRLGYCLGGRHLSRMTPRRT